MDWTDWEQYTTNADLASGAAYIPVTNGETANLRVDFDKAFSSAPKVFINIKTSSPSGKVAYAGNISTTGFTVYANANITGNLSIDWIALDI